MITRLEVDGFKSLQEFAVDLEPFTVFIGPNSAGKSNILEALALLSRLASQPISEAFRQGRGRPSDQFTRSRNVTSQGIRFAVEFLLGEYQVGHESTPPSQSRFRYELTIERQTLPSGTERLVARNERLHAMHRDVDRWVTSRPEYLPRATYAHEGTDRFVALKGSRTEQRIIGPPNIRPEEVRVSPSQAALGQIQYAEACHAAQNLAGLRTLHGGPPHIADPSDRLNSDRLAADASNLATVLADLPPPLLGEIRADLVSLVPGIATFDVVPEGDEIRLEFELSGGDRIPSRLVSDGTLRLLVLLTALRLRPRAPLLCIEEPENGIYPGRLRALLDLLRAETRQFHDDPTTPEYPEVESGLLTDPLPTQILVATHSPVILAALRKHPEYLRFVDVVRRDGHRVTRVRTVAPPSKADRGRFTISPREIELLLNAAKSEEPA